MKSGSSSTIHECDAGFRPRIVGVLGGMGPLATVDFLRKLIDATPAVRDQDHVPVIVSSIPQVPDRTEAYFRGGPSPLEAMISSGRRLIAAGAELIVVPCNTAHLWFDGLQAALDIPMLSLVDEAISEVGKVVKPRGRVGLLCTDATLASGLYAAHRSRTNQVDLNWVLPTADEMNASVMSCVSAVKAGDLAAAGELVRVTARALQARGAEALLLGCTEIPLVLDQQAVDIPMVDATAALARASVRWSLAGLINPSA
jgi:aspartate racemase